MRRKKEKPQGKHIQILTADGYLTIQDTPDGKIQQAISEGLRSGSEVWSTVVDGVVQTFNIKRIIAVRVF